MKKTLTELARIVDGEVVGDGSTVIAGIAGVTEAQQGDITFLSNPKYRQQLLNTKASAVIAAEVIEGVRVPFIITADPYVGYARIAQLFFKKPLSPRGISKEATVASSARIGKDPSIFPHVFVGERVKLGDRIVCYPGVYVGDNASIGDDVVLHPNVTVHHGSVIGDRVVLYPGVVIGGDGFGYAPDKRGKYHKIPQIGIVQIDDDVEIGANSTVDRAALGKTWIKRGVKIDNLVMVAHNVVVGEDTVIVAQSGIAGSTEIGNNVVLAAKAGIAGHLKIGDRATVTATGGVGKDVPAGTVVSGRPAILHRNWLKSKIICGRLPELYEDIRQLKKKVAELEKYLAQDSNKK